MNIAKTIALLGLLAMSVVLVYGFGVGNFAKEGQTLLSMPWGIVSLVDVYVGFTLFSGWIIYREKPLTRAIVWIVLVMVLGNFATSLYALIALVTSGGDWKRFLLGKRA